MPKSAVTSSIPFPESWQAFCNQLLVQDPPVWVMLFPPLESVIAFDGLQALFVKYSNIAPDVIGRDALNSFPDIFNVTESVVMQFGKELAPLKGSSLTIVYSVVVSRFMETGFQSLFPRTERTFQ